MIYFRVNHVANVQTLSHQCQQPMHFCILLKARRRCCSL
nr:MAG TPA: hypothetical protein [Caudoviricetes sp.]